MPKSTQTKPPQPPPNPQAAEPPKTRARVPHNPYGDSVLALLHRLWTVSGDHNRNFLGDLIELCVNEPSFTVAEHAFCLSKTQFPHTKWLPAPFDGNDDYDTLRDIYLMLIDGDWKGKFLETLARRNKEKLLQTPEDALDAVESVVGQFQDEVESAIRLLKEHPHSVQSQIREAIRIHPDLIANS